MYGLRLENHALVWENENETVRIEPWGGDSLRVRASKGSRIRDDLPNALLPPGSSSVQIEMGDTAATIINGKISARFAPGHYLSQEGQISFFRSDSGEELLAERGQHFFWPRSRYFKPVAGDLYHIEAFFKSYDGERIYGLGQHQHGRLDQKGAVIDLVQRNTEVSIPFLLSSRCYGFLWNNPGVGRVELGSTGTRWVALGARQMDYWITAGNTPAEVMENYVSATGHPLMLPEWAAGFWQCKLRYQTQEELLEVAREYHRRGLPLSVIVSDFFHWPMMGEWRFDPVAWPNPAEMVRELESMGVRLMVSVWPAVNALSPNYAEMERRGLLLCNERGVPAHRQMIDTQPEGPVYMHFYDPTNPEARQYIWEKVRQGYYRHGIKVWWLDACEPEVHPFEPENLRYWLGNGLEVSNLYPWMNELAFYEGMRSEGEEDIITLCRSAWAGSQRFGAAVWSGDIPSTFEALQAQVRAGLNIGLSGIPWWTSDIGGFFFGDPASPYFRELIIRWFQYGAFCPLFRLHGYRMPMQKSTGAPNEVWSFGEEAYEILRDLLFLRKRLRPYILDQMKLAHVKGIPPMRPLFFDFTKDPESHAVEDQFMFGPDLLVAPVLHQGERSRQVYLPEGASWRDAWTGEYVEGGRWITVEAPLGCIPLFLRDGADLPIRENSAP